MSKKKINFFATLFDTLFIMILCFSTLFISMLLSGSVILQSDSSKINYTISWPLLFIVLLSLILYITFILKQSDLKKIKKIKKKDWNPK